MLLHHFKYDTNVPKLFELAEENDTVAINILEEWSHSVAEGIAQLQICLLYTSDAADDAPRV